MVCFDGCGEKEKDERERESASRWAWKLKQTLFVLWWCRGHWLCGLFKKPKPSVTSMNAKNNG